MQNIRNKSVVLILLSFIMAFCSTTTAYALNDTEGFLSPYFVNISKCDIRFSISGIKATGTASLSANKSMTLKIKMELQKKKSSGYETVETWTCSKTGTYLAMSESRNINILSNYRLKVTFTAGNETEVVYKY